MGLNRFFPKSGWVFLIQRMTALGCDFNWSMQHLISNYREEDVENEATTS